MFSGNKKVFAAQPKDPFSVLSISCQLTACNSSFRGSDAFQLLWAPALTCTYHHTDINEQKINLKRNAFNTHNLPCIILSLSLLKCA